ncbi:unknown [Bacteroides uniformis CAG:3]|nr:unknown [Bacteroides uniformis CAG:3]
MLVDRGIAVFFGIARVAIQLDNYLFFRTVYEYGECICLRLGFAAAAENQLVVSADGGLQFFFYGVIAILAAFSALVIHFSMTEASPLEAPTACNAASGVVV